MMLKTESNIMKPICYLLSIIVVLLIGSCGFYDKAEVPVSFLKIDSIDQMTTGGQGFNSHALKDIWVYADNELLGVFTPPVDVPVIPTSDSTEIIIFPGIRNNGVALNPIIYPFMDRYESTMAIDVGETVEIDPVFNYRSTVVFEMIEGFEGNHGFTYDADTSLATSILVSETEYFEGNKSGHFSVDENNRTVQVATDLQFSTESLDGREVYLELDYKNDSPLWIGLITTSPSLEIKKFKVFLQAREDWNKVYIDFTNELAFNQVETYRVVLGISLGSAVTGDAYVDNIKLIHF